MTNQQKPTLHTAQGSTDALQGGSAQGKASTGAKIAKGHLPIHFMSEFSILALPGRFPAQIIV